MTTKVGTVVLRSPSQVFELAGFKRLPEFPILGLGSLRHEINASDVL